MCVYVYIYIYIRTIMGACCWGVGGGYYQEEECVTW